MRSKLIVCSFCICCLLFVYAQAQAAVKQKAVVFSVAPDYSSGAHSVIDVDPGEDGSRETINKLKPAESDYTVASQGRYFYRIGRKQIDSIAKFDISDPANPIWQFSTMDGSEEVASSNPYDLVFARPDKAYLLRYGVDKAWIVDPTVEKQENFKTGELDLSAYRVADTAPNMCRGMVLDKKLFILMQRLDSAYQPQDAYLAVFNTKNGTEVETGQGETGFKGIKLPVKNPSCISYIPENDKIYVQGSGSLPYAGSSGDYSGGIASVDPDTYNATMLVDDGNQENHPYGNINGMYTVNASKGYFVGYHGYMNSTLYSFDPGNGEVHGASVDELQNINIPGMGVKNSVDKNNMVWVPDATRSRMVILDPEDDSVNATVDTGLNPQKVAFVTYGTVEDDADHNGIPDNQEMGNYDFDGDGRYEQISATFKGLQAVKGNADIGMQAGQNVNSISEVKSKDPTDALQDQSGDKPASMPNGLLEFSLDVAKGANATVSVYFTQKIEADKWYKYSESQGWEDYTEYVDFTETRDGNTRVDVKLQDGGFGDSDGKENGVIIDPSGPGIAPGGSSSDGGCVMNPDAGFTWDWLLVLSLMPFLLAIRRLFNNRVVEQGL